MSLKGTLEHIPEVDRMLRAQGACGILIGGVAEVFHIAQRDKARAMSLLPRRDTDVLIVDKGREDLSLPDVDLFKRYTYADEWVIASQNTGRQPSFPYWKNRNNPLDVSFTNIDDLNLSEGLHIPDEVFLIRMWARMRMVDEVNDPRLPHHYENRDPLFDRDLIAAKLRRILRGDPEGTTSMDKLNIRPLVGSERYAIKQWHDLRYPCAQLPQLARS